MEPWKKPEQRSNVKLKTMVCLILDRSGSMGGKESDVIGGVNAFLADQRKIDAPCSIAFVRFDAQAIERFRPMMALKLCTDLELHEYQPRGATPLLDAVGQTITQLDADWAREWPDRCIVVIVTDGLENASREYSKAKIKAMIEARQASDQWQFIFLGANIDAFAEAGGLGIHVQNTAAFNATSAGIRQSYAHVSDTVSSSRLTGSTVANNLGGKIEDDGSVTRTHIAP